MIDRYIMKDRIYNLFLYKVVHAKSINYQLYIKREKQQKRKGGHRNIKTLGIRNPIIKLNVLPHILKKLLVMGVLDI